MSATSSSKAQNTSDPAVAPSSLWSPTARWAASLLVLAHLSAVVIAPLSNPPPASMLSQQIASWYEPYLRAAYLGHGYRFFAPNPGPSHLVRYELVMPDESVVHGRFPNLKQHWPRLLYHRHFMISETVNGLCGLPTPQDVDNELAAMRTRADELKQQGHHTAAGRLYDQLRESRESYERSVQLRDQLLRGIANRLLDQHQANEVRLYLQEHLIPTPLDVSIGIQIDDERYYQERLVWTSRRDSSEDR